MIRKEVENFYVNLYKEEQFVRPLLNGMEFTRISGMDNSLLEGKFSENEVWQVVSAMKRDKAPGPDGFTISFFKNVAILLKLIS